MRDNIQPRTTGNRAGVVTAAFLTANGLWVFVISVLILVPCFWHRRLEAGDLGSHSYNIWLAQLAAHGQLPGIHVARAFTNVLFDVLLGALQHVASRDLAEKMAVSMCVLAFFWGAFAFIAAESRRVPWSLTPAIAMFAYGWTMQMGFLNYYIGVGLGFLAIALFRHGRGVDLFLPSAATMLAAVAHPMALASAAATFAYLTLADRVPKRVRWALFAGALFVLVCAHFVAAYLPHEAWRTKTFFIFNGADQLIVYGRRYVAIFALTIVVGAAVIVRGRMHKKLETEKSCRTMAELWVLMMFYAALIPDLIRVPMYPAPVSLLVVRSTCITAVFALAVVACVRPERWHFPTVLFVAVVFFVWMYQDTALVNRMEQSAEEAVQGLPAGTRVIATMGPPAGWRVGSVSHVVDRACIGKCFVYSNYEPSSQQFRVRVEPGNTVATASTEDSSDMQIGEYVVKRSDPPLVQIYHCDERDLTRLCARKLVAGEKNCGECYSLAPNHKLIRPRKLNP